MFIILRIILGCIFLLFSILVAKKIKKNKNRLTYLMITGISIALVIALSFFPFENLFFTFDSPNAAYEYYKLGSSKIENVIEGAECDFVVDRKDNSDSYLIIPKTSEGWKIGIGSNTKRIEQKIADGIVIYVYQYGNTNEYFITIFDTNGEVLDLSDKYDTIFITSEKHNEVLEKTFTTYYAYIPEFTSDYIISVNGNNIEF